MRYGPRFEFARRQDGRRVAYQVVGAGDLDLVFLRAVRISGLRPLGRA